jgi:hypothetical protein
MYWLARPPYVRRAGAVLIVLFAIWFEMAPDPTVLHPFAKADMAAGTAVMPSDFVQKPVPPGFLPEVNPQGVLTLSIAAGDPVMPGMVNQDPVVPSGWWALDVPVPAGVAAGTEVRLLVDQEDSGRVVVGLIVRIQEPDSFEGNIALVAVPEADAAAAAAAVAQGTAAILVGSGG